MRPTLPLMLLGVVGINVFVAFFMGTISDALTPVFGRTIALVFAAAPLLAVLAVWGWYLYGPPDGARAEREAERRKKEGQ